MVGVAAQGYLAQAAGYIIMKMLSLFVVLGHGRGGALGGSCASLINSIILHEQKSHERIDM